MRQNFPLIQVCRRGRSGHTSTSQCKKGLFVTSCFSSTWSLPLVHGIQDSKLTKEKLYSLGWVLNPSMVSKNHPGKSNFQCPDKCWPQLPALGKCHKTRGLSEILSSKESMTGGDNAHLMANELGDRDKTACTPSQVSAVLRLS